MNATVRVNEAALLATGLGVDWWLTFRQRMESTGRITDTTISIFGNICHVTCDSAEEARRLATSMVEDHGLPKRAVMVVRKRGAS